MITTNLIGTTYAVAGCPAISKAAPAVHAGNHLPVSYDVDDVVITGDNIAVDYLLADTWNSHTISYRALKAFVITERLNEFCFDSADHTGNHVQHAGSLDVDTFIREELTDVIKAYFVSNKVGQYNVN